MQNLFKSLIVIMIISSIGASFAANSASKTEPETHISCPIEINCSADKRVSSCKPVGDNLEYWGKIQEHDPVTKGKHHFDFALTTYQSPHYDNTICYYKGMHIYAKGYDHSDSILEASPSKTTNWIISGYRADCHSNNPQLCPLNKIPALGIVPNFKNDAVILAYAHGVQIIDTSQSSNGKITLYQAWNGCSDSKACAIDFVIEENGTAIHIGNVILDMNNKMQILQINSLHSSGYEITQQANLNAIEITQKHIF